MGAMGATPALLPNADVCPPRYRPRNPRATSLYQLLESHYETVKEPWEERFEQRYGFWRGLCDSAVARYLDCGLFESGFAWVKCTSCPNEFLVAFSCNGKRPLHPGDGTERAGKPRTRVRRGMIWYLFASRAGRIRWYSCCSDS